MRMILSLPELKLKLSGEPNAFALMFFAVKLRSVNSSTPLIAVSLGMFSSSMLPLLMR